MKKTSRRIFGFTLVLTALVVILSLAASAAALERISGTVKASECPLGDIALMGDTVLIMDKDITLRSISGNYNLTVQDQGGYVLKITMPLNDNVITANPAGHGISVKSFASNANLDITARKDGLNIDQAINITGGNVKINCGGDAIYSRNSSIAISGATLDVTAVRGCIVTKNGTGDITVSASGMAKTTGEDAYCIIGKNITLTGYAPSLYAISKNNTVVSYGDLTLYGTVTAKSSRTDGVAFNAKSDGNITIKPNAVIYALGGGAAFYATGDFVISGEDASVSAFAGSHGGIVAEGDVFLSGTVYADAKGNAIAAGGKLTQLKGTVNAKTTDNEHYCVASDGDMIIFGDSFTAEANSDAIVCYGNLDINADVTASTYSEDCTAISCPNSPDVDTLQYYGIITIHGGTVQAFSAGEGIYAGWSFLMEDGTLIVRGYAQRAISAHLMAKLNGTVDLKSKKEAVLMRDGGNVEISGNVSIETAGKDYYSIKSTGKMRSVKINSGNISIYSEGGGIHAYDSIQINMENPGDSLMVDASNRSALRTDTGDVSLRGYIVLRSEYASGIYAEGDVVVNDGTLVAVSGANKDGIIVYYPNDVADMYGIYAKDVTVKGKATISAAWNNAVYAAGNVTVSDTGSLDVLSAKGKRSGIVCKGDMTAYGYVRAESYEGIPAIWTDGELKIGYPFVVKYPYNAKIRSDKHTISKSDGSLCNETVIDKNADKDLDAKISLLPVRDEYGRTQLVPISYDWPDDASTANVVWQASTDGKKFVTIRTDKGVNLGHGGQMVQFYSWYTLLAKDYGLYLRAVIDSDEYNGKVASESELVEKKEPLTGTIVFTSGAKIGGKLTTARTGELNAVETADASKVHFKWQRSGDGLNNWENIAGETGSYINITADYTGKYLRLTAKVDGYTGTVCSPAKYIGKAPANDDTLAMSGLTYADGVVTVTRAFADQEYVITLSDNVPEANEWTNAVSPASTGELSFDVSGNYLNNTVYVHTRKKETDSNLAGTRDKYSMVYTGASAYLCGLQLRNSSGSPMTAERTKVGRSVAITVAPLPSDYPNNKWSADTVNWYVNNNPKYPGAVELYSDSACTVPLARDAYGVIQPTTQHTVYMKAASWTYAVTVGASKTVGYNNIVNAQMSVDVANADDLYILQNMYFESLETFPGDEFATAFGTRPDSAYLGEMTFVPHDTNPDGEIAIVADTAAKKLTVTVSEDAEPGYYVYGVYIDGAPTMYGSSVGITVKDKTATVSFDAGDNAQLYETAALMSSQMAPQTVPLGAQFILPENEFYVPDGCEFDGWDLGNAGDGIDVTEDVTVTAKWKQHVHTMIHETGYANSCTTPGRMEHWYCEDCGRWFGDENGNYPIDNTELLMIPAHGHDTTGAEPIVENSIPASCTDDGGYDEIIYCSVCGEEVSREHFDIPATGHIHTKTVREKEIFATCTENGSYNEVVYCTDCGEKLSEEAVNVNAAGHEWTLTDWMWDNEYTEATAVFTCVNDKMHTQTADAQITVDDSGIVNGNVAVVYTAKVTFEGVQYSDEKYNVKTYNGTLSSLDGREISYSLMTDTGEFIVVGSDGYVNASQPVLVVSYDKNGRFIGVSFITQTFFAQRAVANNAASVKVMWWSMSNLHPDSDNTELLLFP